MKWLTVLFAGLVLTACFYPWVRVPGNRLIGGMKSDIGNWGQPGLLHLILLGTVILFVLIGKVWSVRAAFFIAAINIAWALRNYIAISACSLGICPEKLTAIYVILIGSFATTASLLFIRTGSNLTTSTKK